MAGTHQPTTDREVTMSSITVTVSAATADEALAKVAAKVTDGYNVTGRVAERSARHMLWTVEVEGVGDKNDLWVVLTSYGMNPCKALGSVWQTVPGVGAFQ